MIKKLFLCVCLFAICFSCGNIPVTPPDDNSDCFGIYYDYSLYIKVQNNSGDNLLNETNSNYIDIDTVTLYRISKDGCEILLYNEYADISKGFTMLGIGDNTIIQLLLDGNGINVWHQHGNIEVIDDGTDNTCTLLIKWNRQDTDTDTIFTQFVHLRPTKEKSLNGYCEWNLYDKVYYNGNLIVSSWEDNREKMSQGIYPTIVKE